MKIIETIQRRPNALKKVGAIAVTGLLAALPFLGAATLSQADSSRHAPAHGYRNKHDNKKKDHGKYRDKGNNRRGDNYRRRDGDRRRDDRRTYAGVVTRIRNNREFDLRANNRIYNVTASARLPRGLDRGDSVRVYGTRTGENNIKNAKVSITRNR